jgi:cholesterol oxidase
LRALCEVIGVKPLVGGGYEVRYRQYENDNPSRFKETTVTADRVILAAGCVGTAELLLKSKFQDKTLTKLSDKVGFGFSTNGDYLAFVENTKDTVNLTRGPVTTSFARFNTNDRQRSTRLKITVCRAFSRRCSGTVRACYKISPDTG